MRCTTHKTAASVDKITLEVVLHQLQGIADEMQMTQVRSSLSDAVKEAADAATSLFLSDGTVLAQSRSIPFHLGTLMPAVGNILKAFPAETMREGDIYLMNDPYHGGSHLPDIVVAMPILIDGRVVALASSVSHHNDIGGMLPGSLPTNATEIYQEGLRIPPMLYEREGQVNHTLQQILLLNVRTPETLIGDLQGQIGACRIGVRRFQHLLSEYGCARCLEICRQLIELSEARVRADLRQLPDGVYRAEGDLDNDGVTLDKRVHICATVTLKDGTMHVDFTGTSPQTTGPINIVSSAAHAAAFYALRCIVDPTIASNGGCFKPVSLYLPPGSLVGPLPPAAVNARTASTRRLASTILAALRPALPERLAAEGSTLMLILRYIWRNEKGERQVVGDHLVGGTGATVAGDGLDAIAADIGNTNNVPVEAIEMGAPLRIIEQSIRADSGGAGRTRGGNGIVREFEVLSDSMQLVHRGERHYVAARGCEGGEDGALSRSTILRIDGSVEEIPSKAVVNLRRGDRVRMETPGGGGWGPPQQRDPKLIEEDLLSGKVSVAGQTRYLEGHRTPSKERPGDLSFAGEVDGNNEKVSKS